MTSDMALKIRSYFYFTVVFFTLLTGTTAISHLQAATTDNGVTVSTGLLPTAELVNKRIKEVAASNLGESDKSSLDKLHRQTLSHLELASTHRNKANAYQLIIQNGPTEIASLKKEIKQIENGSKSDTVISTNNSLAEIEQALQKQKADVVVTETQLSELDNQRAAETSRPTAIRQRLTDVKKQLAEIPSTPVQTTTDQISELTEAQVWESNSLREQLLSESLMLEQELSSSPIRSELLTAKLDLAVIKLSDQKKHLEQLTETSNRLRLLEAEKAKSDAIAAEREAASKHELVAQLAVKNTSLTEQIDNLAKELEEINNDENEAVESAKRFEEAFNSTRKKLEIAGLSEVLGQVLQQEKRSLPDTRHFQKLASQREQKIATTSLEQIQLEEERQALRNPTQYAKEIGSELTASEKAQVDPELQALTLTRKELIDKALSIQRVYLQSLGDLDVAQRRLQDAVESYSGFLNKRLLWIRSTEPASLNTVQGIPEQISLFIDKQRWSDVAQSFIQNALLSPLLFLALIYSAFVLLMRKKLLLKLAETGEEVGNLRQDRVSETLKAFALIILLSLPIPLLLAASGMTLSSALSASEFSKVVGMTCFVLAPLILHLTAFRLFLAPKSVALVHFDWEPHGAERLHKELGWFTKLTVALALITSLAVQDPTLGSGSGFGRIMFMALMLVFSVLLYRIAKPNGGILSELAADNPESVLIRFKYLWFLMLVSPPLFAIGVSLAGYMFTAGTIIERILQSLWYVLLVIIVHQFIFRWLTLNQRRLRLEAALAKRQAELEAREAKEENEHSEGHFIREIEEPQVDFVALDATSRKLLNNILIFIGFIGIWALWRDLLPALEIFNDITLWTYTRSGSTEITAITLSSLGLAILVFFVTIIATRQLPAFIEITLLQRLNMTQGSRYTVTTLTGYTVVAVGLAWVFSFLGGSWSEIQWIFAALGVGIGFGLQEIVANFISGLIILFERPIRVGDVVTVGNTDGVVTRIQIRATTIRNFDRKELLVPNKNFITQELLNWSLSDQTTRIMIQLGIAYGSDAQKALDILEEVAVNHERVMKDPAPITVFESFGDNALLLSLRCFVEDIDYRLGTITDLNLAISEKMNDAGIEISFPQRDIHLDTKHPLDIRLLNYDNTKSEG
ncbi:mechanosensitive ion channel domain-containing protein [Neptuniibacter sp. PT8_73]|uniref:mechanosensitive ion channel domain-containing protein n=1 Tax=Neptuniibacter sp. PT8_73 TaxID=3398206 RepID=UPI0039F60804